jgi:predicted XRE-type DNA-binding protein
MEDYLIRNQRANVPNIGKLGKLSNADIKKIANKINLEGLNLNDGNDIEKKCWLWTGHIPDKINKGHQHGTINYNDKTVLVHRIMYHNFVSDVPIYERKSGALQVNHKCSHQTDGRCINYSHMYLGTPKDNMQDALRDGTKNKAPSGEQNYNATVLDKKIKEILDELEKGELSQSQLAKKYGVVQSQISRWKNKKTRTINWDQ